MIKIEDLYKKYDNKIIFKNLNVSFQKGKIYSIFGANGVGKTTLLNIISNETSFDGGKCENNLNTILLTDPYPILDFLSIFDFLKLSLELKNIKISEEKLNFELQKIQLYEDRNVILQKCSQGTKHKTSLLLALLIESEVLLLDEPFASIDMNSLIKIKQYLKEYSLKNNSIIIITSHIPSLVADISDYILHISNNKIMKIDTNEIKQIEKTIINLNKKENQEE